MIVRSEREIFYMNKMTYYDEISEGYEELHKEEQLKKISLIKKHLKVNSPIMVNHTE